MAIFQAFYDDSGSDDASPVILVGGYISTVALWDKLAIEWAEKLKEWGLTWFHMSEAEKRDGYGWTWQQREERVVVLGNLIQKYLLHSIAVGMDRRAWDEAMSPQLTRTKTLEHDVGFPYLQTYTGALRLTSYFCDMFGASYDNAEIVVAKQKHDGPKAKAHVQRVCDNFGLSDPHFDCPQRLAALQAADMFAWFMNSVWRDGESFVLRDRHIPLILRPRRSTLLMLTPDIIESYAESIRISIDKDFAEHIVKLLTSGDASG